MSYEALKSLVGTGDREWWREWSYTAEVVALDPVKFVGHDGTFPAPLVLAHRNAPKPGQMTELCVRLGLGGRWR